ncbi:MAG: transporter substrate-binding domain-containing protein [Polyangiaceae bacterium]|nr:transporter substrate-binding domain-containing protein [Polyangiaceae bacterium]
MRGPKWPCSARGAVLEIALGLSLSLLWCAFAPASARAEGREVRVGVYENEPKIFTDRQGQPAGIFMDLLAAVAREERWKLVPVRCDWAECLRLLESGRVDLMPDVAFSFERAERYDFNRTPVLESWSQLYARAADALSAPSDLDGKRVALLQGSIQQRHFEQMMSGLGLRVHILPRQSFDEAFRLAASGEADAAVANRFFGERQHRAYGLEPTPIVFQVAQLHFATRKGQNAALLQAVDAHMEAWHAKAGSPYYLTLARWTTREPERIVPGYVPWVVGLTLGLLFAASITAWGLRRQVRTRTRRLDAANRQLTKAQRALLESSALLQTTQRLSGVGGWQWSIDDETMTFTAEALRIYGFAPDESPTSVGLDEALAPFGAEGGVTVRDALTRCVERWEAFDLTLPFRSSADRSLWVRVTGEALKDADGRVAWLVGNVMDVTERKRAEAERRKLEEQQEVSRRMQAIGQLAGGVAHDFNNLITVIDACARFAAKDLDESSPAREDLATIQDAAARATALTAQLLAFGRKQFLQPEPVDLNALVHDLEGMLRPLVGEEVELVIHTSPDGPTVLADPGKLEQVVVNLVTNARDAMPGGGTLTIRVEATAPSGEGRALLSVTDTGSGMDEETRARIFEPFFTTKAQGKGTGLGLATIQGIVEQSGGQVEVRSELGRGTTFTVSLPCADATPVVSTKAKRAAPLAGTEAVLVVEDDDLVRAATQRHLTAAGYTVVTASSGPDALHLCKTRKAGFDLLLSDVQLPRMTGPELARILAESHPRMKVLFMSGTLDEGVASGGLGGLLRKPFTADELSRAVREVLDQPA